MDAKIEERAQLFESAPCGLARLDHEFAIQTCNSYFTSLAARSQPLIGMKFSSLLSVAGRIYLQTRLQQELALTGRMEELVLDMVAEDGTRTPVMLNAVQRLDVNGRPQDIQIAVWRAAAKRAYEAEVPRARLAAAEAARVKADFLANISHEMRTPLNGVIGMAGVLGSTALTDDQREMVETIAASGQALTRLVGDVLDLAKVKAGALSLNLASFCLMDVTGVLEATRLEAERKGLGFDLVWHVNPDACFVGDVVRLKQILAALLSNAVKFTETGSVRLTVATDAEGRVDISVVDTGIGFDDSAAATLFAEFQQADGGITRNYGGAGLGLSITKALVELMDGSITAKSRVGEGSLFRVVLPLQPAQADPRSLPSEAAGSNDIDERPLRVLLVEDNPTNQKVVQMILASCDIELVIADNGATGLEAWRGSPFDLVLMDMQMPVMDGLTAIRCMRETEAREMRVPRTPIVVLSANAMEHHRREAVDAGADMHLAKPITPQGLLDGMSQALELA